MRWGPRRAATVAMTRPSAGSARESRPSRFERLCPPIVEPRGFMPWRVPHQGSSAALLAGPALHQMRPTRAFAQARVLAFSRCQDRHPIAEVLDELRRPQKHGRLLLNEGDAVDFDIKVPRPSRHIDEQARGWILGEISRVNGVYFREEVDRSAIDRTLQHLIEG